MPYSVSVDLLLDYQPQTARREIRALYRQGCGARPAARGMADACGGMIESGRRHLSQKQALIKRMEKACPPMCQSLHERAFSVAVKVFSSCMALPHYSRTAQIRHFDSPDFGMQASETAVIICKLRSDMI